MTQYRDEVHATVRALNCGEGRPADDLLWTSRDAWADSMLEQWGRWSRDDRENIDYPTCQPFATRTGRGLPVCDALAEKVNAALMQMDTGWRLVLKTKYHSRGYMAPKTHLKALREFSDAFECMGQI